MNMMKNTLLAATLIACTATAFAAPTDGMNPRQMHKPCPEMMMPPPPAPVYAVIQQTETPNETLASAVKNVPTLDKGKRYEVRIEVKELPPAPPATLGQPSAPQQ